MYPSAENPASGRFVYDQLQALSQIETVQVELFAFNARGRGIGGYLRAVRRAHRLYNRRQFDIVHSHFGLSAWVGAAVKAKAHVTTFHGTDLVHPRSRIISQLAVPSQDLLAVASNQLSGQLPSWSNRPWAVLPCGVDTTRFRPIDRQQACRTLGLDPAANYVLFPADPSRREKRYDRLQQLQLNGEILTLGRIDPETVPLYINASKVVAIPSEREGFGLAALEAIACNVPVISTVVGAAPVVLDSLTGCHCADFLPETWESFINRQLASTDSRLTDGRGRAELFGAALMAERLATAWQQLLQQQP